MTAARARKGKSADGLGAWIEEVAILHKKASVALRVEVVHELRVAIRRCRSLAQGLREIDDDEGAAQWRALADAGRPLFQGLGELRDAQVMREHAARLLANDVSRDMVLAAIDARIRAVKEGARAAVMEFDVNAWRAAGEHLPARARLLLEEKPLFDHLALRRYFEARELHQGAMRSKSSVALHELRIGTKKLRYSVENFLADAHAAVGKPLKKMQEILGDLHDHDVLIAFLSSEHVRLYSEDRSRACQLVRAERDARLAAYRELALGDDGAWVRIRGALADGAAVSHAHRALILKKAAGRGVHRGVARSLERSALVLLRAFESDVKALGDVRAPGFIRWAAACALTDGGGKGARKLVEGLPLAVGFSVRDRDILGILARSAGRAPRADDPPVRTLPPRDAQLTLALGAVLHLAAGLLAGAPFTVEDGPTVATLHLSRALADPTELALRRGPLELLLHKPIWWTARPLRASAPRRTSAQRRT